MVIGDKSTDAGDSMPPVAPLTVSGVSIVCLVDLKEVVLESLRCSETWVFSSGDENPTNRLRCISADATRTWPEPLATWVGDTACR